MLRFELDSSLLLTLRSSLSLDFLFVLRSSSFASPPLSFRSDLFDATFSAFLSFSSFFLRPFSSTLLADFSPFPDQFCTVHLVRAFPLASLLFAFSCETKLLSSSLSPFFSSLSSVILLPTRSASPFLFDFSFSPRFGETDLLRFVEDFASSFFEDFASSFLEDFASSSFLEDFASSFLEFFAGLGVLLDFLLEDLSPEWLLDRFLELYLLPLSFFLLRPLLLLLLRLRLRLSLLRLRLRLRSFLGSFSFGAFFSFPFFSAPRDFSSSFCTPALSFALNFSFSSGDDIASVAPGLDLASSSPDKTFPSSPRNCAELTTLLSLAKFCTPPSLSNARLWKPLSVSTTSLPKDVCC